MEARECCQSNMGRDVKLQDVASQTDEGGTEKEVPSRNGSCRT